MNTGWWRSWHRWIGFPAAVFLLFASVTGFLLATTEFFGADEALREATRNLSSPITTSTDSHAWSDVLGRVMPAAQQRAPGAPIAGGGAPSRTPQRRRPHAAALPRSHRRRGDADHPADRWQPDQTLVPGPFHPGCHKCC